MSKVIPIRRALDPSTEASPATLYLARLRPGSRRAQMGALRTLIHMQAGPACTTHPHWYPWHTLTPADAGDLRANLADTYAPATARRILSALRGVVTAAWQLGQLDADTRARICDVAPIKGSRLPAGRALTPDEVRALYKAASQHDAIALALLLGAGMRRDEAVQLQADAIAVERAASQLRESPGETPPLAGSSGAIQNSSTISATFVPACQPPPIGGWMVAGTVGGAGPATLVRLAVAGKGGRERAIYLAGRDASALAQWIEGREPGAYVLDVRSGNGLWRRLRALARAAGVPPFTPHDLRRTYASRALSRIDIATVQASMGHADPRTTARYDRRGEEALRTAARLLATETDPVLP